MNAPSRQGSNVLGRAGIVRRERDQADEIAGSSLPAEEFSEIRRTYMLARMRAARAVFGCDVWTFHMHEWNHVHEQRVCGAGGGDHAQVADDLLLRCSDERGNKRGDTGDKHAPREASNGI